MTARLITTRGFWIGAGATIAVGLAACSSQYSISTEVLSPNGEQRAILYVGMGGGAAGWCYQHLAVARTGATFDPQVVDSRIQYVFSASCSSEVSTQWTSEQELRVSYTLDSQAGTSLYQRPSTPDGLVRLTFVPQP